MRRERGATSIGLVMVIAFAVSLASAYAARVVWRELQAADQRVRAVQAVEAAESALAWGTARLNDDRPLDETCLPVASGPSFRERSLGSAPVALCQHLDAAWTCRCPPPPVSAMSPAGGIPAGGISEAFALRVVAGAASAALGLEATGCSGAAAACLLPSDRPTPAGSNLARAWADVARLPALDARPVAAITARGRLQLKGSPTVVHQQIASGGFTLHAGADIDSADAALVGPPGTPGPTTVIAGDGTLAALTPAQFFASAFRMDAAAWQAQPAARTLACSEACDAALAQLVGAPGAPTLVWLDGGLHLDSATELGSAQRPVLFVVDGPVQLRTAVHIHGVLYLRSADWLDSAGATLQGAVLAEGDLRLEGLTRIEHDGAALLRLNDCCGSVARMPGSWRDF